MAAPDYQAVLAAPVGVVTEPGVGYVQAKDDRSGLVDDVGLAALAAAAEVIDRTAGYWEIVPIVRPATERILWMGGERPYVTFAGPVSRILGWRAYDRGHDTELGRGAERATGAPARPLNTWNLTGLDNQQADRVDALVVMGYGLVADSGADVEATINEAQDTADMATALQDAVTAATEFTPVVGESMMLHASSGDGEWAWGVNLLTTSWDDTAREVEAMAEIQWWGDNDLTASQTMDLGVVLPDAELSNVTRAIVKRWASQIAQPGYGAFPPAAGGGAPPSTPSLTYQLERSIKRFAPTLRPELY